MKNKKISGKKSCFCKLPFIASAFMWLFAAIGFSGICCSLAAWGLLGASGIAIAAFFTSNQLVFLALALSFLLIGLIYHFNKKTCNCC